MEKKISPKIPQFLCRKMAKFLHKKNSRLEVTTPPYEMPGYPHHHPTVPRSAPCLPERLNPCVLFVSHVCMCAHFRAIHCARCSRAPPPLLPFPISRLLFCSLLDLSSFKDSILNFSIFFFKICFVENYRNAYLMRGFFSIIAHVAPPCTHARTS